MASSTPMQGPPSTTETAAPPSAPTSDSPFYTFTPAAADGTPYPLSQLRNKVVLVVNTASRCGFTPQYTALEALYKKFNPSGSPDGDFVVLAVPCNQFNNQEPGDNSAIQNFCEVNFSTTFPILGKADVNGENATPLYKWLKEEKAGLMGLRRVKWNFEKFLVGRDGRVVGRWASTTKPEALEATVAKALKGGEGEKL
ncbi:MAG: hypothetical protein M1829_001248 [Trizodia sp. TS-e1964]|nr:MAG: hypothetical protein M1829_001248 [Trizodia sp. TS-e1964]